MQSQLGEDPTYIPPRFKIHRFGRLFKYENFVQKQENFHIIDDFNWEEHAFSILQRYTPELTEFLNSQMVYAFQMTKNSFGGLECDTEIFRNTIQMYLMFIFGIKDDAYQQQYVNKVLKKQHKIYIKKMMCEP